MNINFLKVRNEDTLRNVIDENFKTTINVNGSFQKQRIICHEYQQEQPDAHVNNS